MHWNYRLVVTAESETEREVEICEVYYDDAGEPTGYLRAVPGSSIGSGVRDELLSVLARMEACLCETVLKYEGGRLVDTGECL